MSISKASTITFVAYSIPVWLDHLAIQAFIDSVREIIRVRRRYFHDDQRYDLAFDFKAGTDVFKALKITVKRPYIYINHLEIRLKHSRHSFAGEGVETVSYDEPGVAAGTEVNESSIRPRLKIKTLNAVTAECHICRNDLDGRFSTPCWDCRNAQCYDCVRQQFRTAMSDIQRFPARCCQYAIHSDVAKEVLHDGELAQYKTRFEEWLTKERLYCPVPTCSTFIPPRIIGKLGGNGTIDCPSCQFLFCLKCKQQAHIGKLCKNNEEQDKTIAAMKKFGYKQCPKCGTAVGKMYGCSHMQCTCGAHWCWNCQRKIELCYAEPCDGGRVEVGGDDEGNDDEGNDDEDNDDEDSEDEDSEDEDNEDEDNEDEDNEDEDNEDEDNEDEDNEDEDNDDDDDDDDDATWWREQEELERERNQVQQREEELERERQEQEIAELRRFEIRLDPLLLEEDVARIFGTNNAGLNINSNVNVNVNTDSNTDTDTDTDTNPNTNTNTNTDTNVESANLDDPHLRWENGTFDFGSEPEDEDTMDVWGCVHKFKPVFATEVPRHWMTASVSNWWDREVADRKVECMVCREDVRMVERGEDEDEDEDENEEKEKNAAKDWRIASRCEGCNIIVCQRCRVELGKEDA